MKQRVYDVAVIGAGVAGVAAATKLALSGHSVLVVAAHHRHPREFRAEKFGAYEANLLERLGLWDAARSVMTPFDETWVGNWGKLLDRVTMREYSTRYPEFVDTLRAAVPTSVDKVVGRVDHLVTSDDSQEIVLADGRRDRARLIVLATGLFDGLRRQLGIDKVVISGTHSLVYGYTLAAATSTFPFQSLTWRGERFGDGISYLTLFPLAGTMRANLFTHWSPSGEDAKAFMRDPEATILQLMPGLTRFCGSLAIAGTVEQRPVDLIATKNTRQDGVVLIGDAFCTSCPSTGTGIRKVLTDVERLVAHVPKWLATPGMSASKIAQFYADPIKAECDDASVSISLTGRQMLTEGGLNWRVRRLRSYVYRRGRHELGQLQTRSNSLVGRILRRS